MSILKRNITNPNKRTIRVLKWILPAIIVASFIVNYISIFDKKMDMNGDNYVYYILAHSISQGNGYSLNLTNTPDPHLHFPPGYPAFLAPFMLIFNNNIVALKIINGVLLILSLLLLYVIIHKTKIDGADFLAFIACILCTFHPILLRWSTILMSEMLFLFLSMAIIAICQDIDIEKLKGGSKKQIILLAALCALIIYSYLTRTIGLSLIIAVILSFCIIGFKEFLKKNRKNAAFALGVSLAVTISLLAGRTAWDIRNHKVSPDYKSGYLADFVRKEASDEKMTTIGDWADRIGTNTKNFITYYIPKSLTKSEECVIFYNEIPAPNAWNWLFGILMIAIISFGLFHCLGLSWLMFLYTLITFSVLMLYQKQFSGTRYFVPLLPILIAGMTIGIFSLCKALTKKVFKKKTALVAAGLVLIIVAIPLSKLYVRNQKYDRDVAELSSYLELPEDNPFRNYLIASEAFSELSNDVVTACRKPEIFNVQSNFHKCIGIPRSGSPEEIIKYLRDNGAHFIIYDNWFPTSYKVLYPTLVEFPEQFELSAQIGKGTGSAMILRFIP